MPPYDLTKNGPGKYGFLVDAVAHHVSLDGCDEECGDSTEIGAYYVLSALGFEWI